MVAKTMFGENVRVEFKKELPKRHERFLKDVIAFANTSGGKILVGISDDGQVTGIGNLSPFRLSDTISNMIADSCTPQINTEIFAKTLEGKTVLEIEVFPGRYRPYYLQTSGKRTSCYIRVNGTSRPADERKIRELEIEGMKVSYDSTPEIGIPYKENLARELCEKMYQTAINACRTDAERRMVKPMTIEKLEDWAILQRNGRLVVPTRAFSLLTQPTEPFIKIQCALFKGNDRTTFIDKKEFTGAIYEQIEEAYRFVLTHVNLGAEINGLYRRDLYELPIQSVREVITNAVLHRSYLDPSCIQVSIYNDRVEVDSPGMLFGGLTVEDAIMGKSKCRNMAIAEAFRYMKIVEAWGTGLPRLYRQCLEMGLEAPKVVEFGDGIKVTIFRNPMAGRKVSDKKQAIKSKRQKQAIKASDKKQTAKSRAHREKILAFLNEHGDATASDIAEYLGLSRDRTRVLLKGMCGIRETGGNRNRRYGLG
ncbi:MAG: putative DNA binding domain-containing protein [Kiritimatiellae bacterium]|nr:putative DNA binding domain-containing protein [Kiritimatiellia bacterium]